MSQELGLGNLKIIAAGGGTPTKSSRPAIERALYLAEREKPRILIIPTAKRTHEAFERSVPATQYFFEQTLGLVTMVLHDFDQNPGEVAMRDRIDAADVIYTTGGDTLHAMEFLRRNKCAEQIATKALAGNVVLAGISAGAILPMEWGHSDSLSYRPETSATWNYVRADGLGLVPFAVSPHFNTQDPRLGKRSEAFANMLQDEPPITAFGIDNLAAIEVVDGTAGVFQSDQNHTVHIAHVDTDRNVHFVPMAKGERLVL